MLGVGDDDRSVGELDLEARAIGHDVGGGNNPHDAISAHRPTSAAARVLRDQGGDG